MENTIVWSDIPVTNLDRAIAFYSAVLGTPVKKEKMGPMELGMLPHADKNASGCLAMMKDNKPSTAGPLVYFNVEGRIDAAIKAVTEHGGKIVINKEQIGPYGFRAVVIDSEGNRVALHSQKA